MMLDIIFGKNPNFSMYGLIILSGDVFQRRNKSIFYRCVTHLYVEDILHRERLEQSATKWFLLANSIQGCDQVLQGMSKVSIHIEHLKAR